MKKISNKFKLLLVIIILIIISGITIIATKGFEFALEYEKTNEIQLYLSVDFNKEDIKQITDETMSNKPVLIQKVEVFEDTVSIISKQITEEEKTNTINKVNEKYGLEIDTQTVDITHIPHTKLRDIFRPYLVPFLISTILVLGYIGIRYNKQNIIKVIFISAITIVLSELIILSIIAITRIPIGVFTLSYMLVAYILTVLGLSIKFEKDNKKQKELEENIKNK